MALSKDDIFDLLAKRLDGIITPEEEALLAQEIENNEEARLAWFNLQKKWDDVALKAYLADIDMDDQRQKFRTRMKKKDERVRKIKRISLAAAASILLIAAIAGVYVYLTPSKAISGVSLQLADGTMVELPTTDSSTIETGSITLSTYGNSLTAIKEETGDTSWNTLHVPHGKDYNITLPDNSVARLNAGTTLKFPFSFAKGKREVIIVDGEAYFSIAPDANRPLIVHTWKGDIKVLGTNFNVNVYDSTFTTSLVSGSLLISVIDVKKEILLAPGYQAVLDSVSNKVTVQEFDESEVLSWLKGIYPFSDASLEDISKLVERIYNVKIKITDPDLAKESFTGAIDKNETIFELFKNMNLEPMFTYTIDKNEITLYPIKK